MQLQNISYINYKHRIECTCLHSNYMVYRPWLVLKCTCIVNGLCIHVYIYVENSTKSLSDRTILPVRYDCRTLLRVDYILMQCCCLPLTGFSQVPGILEWSEILPGGLEFLDKPRICYKTLKNPRIWYINLEKPWTDIIHTS